jgi:hypothetical protein
MKPFGVIHNLYENKYEVWFRHDLVGIFESLKDAEDFHELMQKNILYKISAFGKGTK